MKNILNRLSHIERGQTFRSAGHVRRQDGTLGNLFCCPETDNEIAIYTDGWRWPSWIPKGPAWLAPQEIVD